MRESSTRIGEEYLQSNAPAAFLCAEEGGLITNEQLWRAGRSEYEAMGKVAYQPLGARLAL